MIIVTGAAGFIGSRLALELMQRGHQHIVPVDFADSEGKKRNIAHIAHKTILPLLSPEEFISRVRQGSEDLGLGFGKPKVVFHQGACSDTTVSDEAYVQRVNIDFTQDLIRWCSKHGVPCIFASSASVYGNGDNGFREEPACESPLNLYARSKHQVDVWYRANFENGTSAADGASHKSQIVGLRYFNVYGEQENHKGRMASVIWNFHHQIKAKGSLNLFSGSENFVRDFVHVRDVIAVNLFFWENPQISGLFNVGTGHARSFLDIAQIMTKVHPGSSINLIPFPDDLRGKYQAFTQADLTRLRAAGYQPPFLSLEEGVESYARNLVENDGWIV